MALSDVLEAWKHLLLDKLHLSRDSSPLPDNYELIRKEYESFLKRTNTVDLIDVYNMYQELKRDEDPEDLLTAVSTSEQFAVPAASSTPCLNSRCCFSRLDADVRVPDVQWHGGRRRSRDDPSGPSYTVEPGSNLQHTEKSWGKSF